MSAVLAALERIERLLAALDRLLLPGPGRAAFEARVLATSGLSRQGVEWALERCIERTPNRAELTALIGSVGRSPRAHVILPGSVFVAAHRALALALATSPRVSVKPSRRDPALIEGLHAEDPELFRLVQQIEPEPGDHVFAYGSDVTLESLRRELPRGTVLHAHGSGFGVAVVDAAAGDAELGRAARAIAEDTLCFEQRGCLSPRFVLALGGGAEAFAVRLAGALAELEQVVPIGRLDDSERAEATWYRECAVCAGTLLPAGSGAVSLRAPPEAWMAGSDDGAFALEVPPAGRHLEVIPIARLEPALVALRRWITSVGCASPELEGLVRPWLDPVRVTALGQMQRPAFDGPVDRRRSPRGEIVGC